MGSDSFVVERPPVLPFPPQGMAPIFASAVPVTQPAPPKPRKILLAEDCPDMREFLTMFLTHKGHRVYAAADGAEAVAMAPDVRPDIAVLNNLMPRMSGITACSLISEMPCLDGLPIVVYSACPLEQFRAHALAAGAWACWHTPMSMQDFLAKTAKVLAGGGRDPASHRKVF